jgi:hypothetical protein
LIVDLADRTHLAFTPTTILVTVVWVSTMVTIQD